MSNRSDSVSLGLLLLERVAVKLRTVVRDEAYGQVISGDFDDGEPVNVGPREQCPRMQVHRALMGSAGAGHEEMDTAVRFQMLHVMVVPAEAGVRSVAKDREQMLDEPPRVSVLPGRVG